MSVRVFRSTGGFDVLVVKSKRPGVTRLYIPRWLAYGGVGAVSLALASHALMWTGTLGSRRSADGQTAVTSVRELLATSEQAPVASAAPACAPTAAMSIGDAAKAAVVPAGATKTTAVLNRRLDMVTAEVARWSELHASIWSSVDAKKGRAPRGVGGPEPSRAKAAPEEPTDEKVDRLLVTVKEEGERLRALNRYMIRAGKVLAVLPSRLPTLGPVNSGFGPRRSPFSASDEFHEGIDIAASPGTAVKAPGPGTVVFAGVQPGYGKTLVLDHGHDIKSRFGHLHVIQVVNGQRVERGDLIALSGNTGRSTGPHLHYEVTVKGRPVDPRKYLLD